MPFCDSSRACIQERPHAARRVVQQIIWRPPQISAVAMAAYANDSEDAPLTLVLSFSSSTCSRRPSSYLACTVLVSGTCGYWCIGAVCGRRRYTPGRGGTGREGDGLGVFVVQVGVWVWCAWGLLRPVRSSFKRSTFDLVLACLMNGATWIALVIWWNTLHWFAPARMLSVSCTSVVLWFGGRHVL
jgi:hypothetical protein